MASTTRFESALATTLTKYSVASQLKPLQSVAIQYLCSMERDAPCHTFVTLPTGYGKSLIFGLSPLVLDSMHPERSHKCIVKMPLRSLILDQVARWKEAGVKVDSSIVAAGDDTAQESALV